MSVDQIDAGSATQIADALLRRFTAAHGGEPMGCFVAPGRVNLIGEHVDYNDGCCLPMALPHATYAVLSPRGDDRFHVTSLQQEQPWRGSVSALGPGQVTGWAAYVAGVGWALQQEGITFPGVDILVDSRVPVGSGLSSSAALECSVALGLCELAEVKVDEEVRRTLVRACMRAEAEVAGAPTGGMDQTVSLFARVDHALLIDCQDWTTEQVPWDPAGADLALLVVDTRAEHSLTDGGYEARRRDCETAARTLGVRSLRQVQDPDAALAGLGDERVRRRARHVFTEMARVNAAVTQLKAGDFAGLGRTFLASHVSLRDDFEVSCPELDTVVDTAMQHGALGARMTGGGFGGSAIALVPQDRMEEVGKAVSRAFTDRDWPAPGLLLASPAEGARRIR